MAPSGAVRLAARLANARAIFIVCGLFGVIAFLLIYGTAVLDFRYTAWLMQGYDPTQHYTGWLFFRNSGWHFPIGLMDNIVYPNKVSVIYTDSIPLFAVPFKLLASVLPTSFQYFGLFGLLCYFLQGAVSGMILFRLGRSVPFAFVGSWFFILSTTLIQRVFFHNALAAHFILLLCIYVCITKNDRPRTFGRDLAKWCGLFCLAASIHAYFIPMVLIFALGFFINDCIATRRFRIPIITFVLSTIPGLLVLYVLGAFYGSGSRADVGLGSYSANLLTMVNPATQVDPLDWSKFLKGMTTVSTSQDEGFAYLGLGILLAVFLAIISLFRHLAAVRTAFQSSSMRRRLVTGMVVFMVFFLIALSPTITVEGHIVLTYHLPDIVTKVWSIFRSSGRFIWVPAYLVMFAALWILRKDYKRSASIVMVVLLIIQVVDLSPALSRAQHTYASRVTWQTKLPSPAWDEIGQNFKHINFLWSSDRLGYLQDMEYSFGDLAGRYDMTVSDYNLARDDTPTITALRQQSLQNIINGVIDPATVYVLDPAQAFAVSRQTQLALYVIDDNIVALPASFTFTGVQVPRLNPIGSTADISSILGTNQVGAVDVNGVRIVHASGTTWSHAIPLPAGSYLFTWTGIGLSGATCSVASGPNKDSVPSEFVTSTDKTIQLAVSLTTDLQNVLTMCTNVSNNDITVNTVTVEETA